MDYRARTVPLGTNLLLSISSSLWCLRAWELQRSGLKSYLCYLQYNLTKAEVNFTKLQYSQWANTNFLQGLLWKINEKMYTKLLAESRDIGVLIIDMWLLCFLHLNIHITNTTTSSPGSSPPDPPLEAHDHSPGLFVYIRRRKRTLGMCILKGNFMQGLSEALCR